MFDNSKLYYIFKFQEFNPNLIGFAVSDSLSFQKASQFNIAVSGAVSGDIPFMTERLIERMKNDSRVNIERDWKVREIFLSKYNIIQIIIKSDLKLMKLLL